MDYRTGDCLWDIQPKWWYSVYRRRKWLPWSEWQWTGQAYTNPEHAKSSVHEMNSDNRWWCYKVKYELLPTYPDGTIDYNWLKLRG